MRRPMKVPRWREEPGRGNRNVTLTEQTANEPAWRLRQQKVKRKPRKLRIQVGFESFKLCRRTDHFFRISPHVFAVSGASPWLYLTTAYVLFQKVDLSLTFVLHWLHLIF